MLWLRDKVRARIKDEECHNTKAFAENGMPIRWKLAEIVDTSLPISLPALVIR